jgi:phosphoribosyl-AMP cyclohydrolase
MTNKIDLEEGKELNLQFEKRGGLLPVVVQELSSGKILMLASINKAAFDKTNRSNKATFYSTSRQTLWTKGETSGNFLEMKNIIVDCDQDAVIYQVELMGNGVCHTFNSNKEHRKACFYRTYNKESKRLEFINATK